ncbi:hypothetical protein H2202_002723 [Exophiala xenobiotica]|nr:hypothetical protein H2202_002723 [Exophiala xenobiotica]
MGAITRSQTQRARTKNEDQSPDAPAPKKVKHMIQPFRPKKTHKLNAVSPAATVNAYLKALKEAYSKLRVAPKKVCCKDARQNKWEELGEEKNDFGMASSVAKGAKGRGFMCLVATPDTGVYENSHATKIAPSDWSPERREQYVEAQASTHVQPHSPTLICTLDFLEYALEALGGDQIVTMPTMAVLFTKDGLKTRTRTIKKKSDTHSLFLRYKWLESNVLIITLEIDAAEGQPIRDRRGHDRGWRQHNIWTVVRETRGLGVSFLHHTAREERSRGQEGRNECLPSYAFVAVRDEESQAAIPAEGQRGINKDDYEIQILLVKDEHIEIAAVNVLILSKHVPDNLSKESVLEFIFRSINERFSPLISKASDD